MGDFPASNVENGLGIIFVTGLDAYKHGGESSHDFEARQFRGRKSALGHALPLSGLWKAEVRPDLDFSC